jgi:amino acid permease
VGPAFYLGMGTGFATFLSFFNLTLCSAFGSNERVLLVCKFFMLLPLIIFAILFLIGGALQQ